MISKAAHERRNKLTEHKTNYKLCNTDLIECYVGLYPPALTKLSLVIFNSLLSTKRYHKPDSQYYSSEEDRRIFTNVPLNPSIILKKCHPVKYRFEKKDASKDTSNLVKRIKDLDDNNIFYVWKYGYPHNYMFVMERDIGLWKFYNPSACVTPKTLRKVIYSFNGMTKSMHKMNEKSDLEDVKSSFCHFINHLVSKTHEDVQSQLPLWENGGNYKTFLISLRDQIDTLNNPYEGLEQDPHFHERLPEGITSKLIPKKKKIVVNDPDLVKELTPKEEGLDPKKEKTKKKRIPKKDPLEIATFLGLDPFKNALNFVKFYRAMIHLENPKADFYSYETEIPIAMTILDMLEKNSREDKIFLKSWVSYYINNKLKGNNMHKKDATSLRSFKGSFKEYNDSYVSFQV